MGEARGFQMLKVLVHHEINAFVKLMSFKGFFVGGHALWLMHLSPSPCPPHRPTAIEVKVKLLSRVRLFATPWTVAYQASLSMDPLGENTGVGYHFLLQGLAVEGPRS